MILSASATKITSENRARIYKTDDKKEEEEEEEEERKDLPTATERESARKLVVYLLFLLYSVTRIPSTARKVLAFVARDSH